MIALKGVIQNGQVKLSSPADLPDGTEVTVLPHAPERMLGIPDVEWPTAPDDVVRLLTRMDRLEPFDMTATGANDPFGDWRP